MKLRIKEIIERIEELYLESKNWGDIKDEELESKKLELFDLSKEIKNLGKTYYKSEITYLARDVWFDKLEEGLPEDLTQLRLYIDNIRDIIYFVFLENRLDDKINNIKEKKSIKLNLFNSDFLMSIIAHNFYKDNENKFCEELILKAQKLSKHAGRRYIDINDLKLILKCKQKGLEV